MGILKVRRRLWRAVKEFGSTTSIHGLNTIIYGNLLCTSVWICFFLASFSLCFYLCVQAVLKLQAHEVVTAITLRSDQVPFPAVTLCNLNPYKKSLMANITELSYLDNVMRSVANRDTTSGSLIGRRKRQIAYDSFPDADDHTVVRSKRASPPGYTMCAAYTVGYKMFLTHMDRHLCYWFDTDPTTYQYNDMYDYCLSQGGHLPYFYKPIDLEAIAQFAYVLGRDTFVAYARDTLNPPNTQGTYCFTDATTHVTTPMSATWLDDSYVGSRCGGWTAPYAPSDLAVRLKNLKLVPGKATDLLQRACVFEAMADSSNAFCAACTWQTWSNWSTCASCFSATKVRTRSLGGGAVCDSTVTDQQTQPCTIADCIAQGGYTTCTAAPAAYKYEIRRHGRNICYWTAEATSSAYNWTGTYDICTTLGGHSVYWYTPADLEGWAQHLTAISASDVTMWTALRKPSPGLFTNIYYYTNSTQHCASPISTTWLNNYNGTYCLEFELSAPDLPIRYQRSVKQLRDVNDQTTRLPLACVFESPSDTTNSFCTPYDCTWAAWTTWSACSATCNGGTQTRSRTGTGADSRCSADPELQYQSCGVITCPSNAPQWKYGAGDKYYLALETPTNWITAKMACEALSNSTMTAQLVTIHSVEENVCAHDALDEMRIFTNNIGTGWGWLGLMSPYSDANNKIFTTFIDNTSVTYVNWFSVDPNTAANVQNCVVMNLDSAVFNNVYYLPATWGDNVCSASVRPICQASMRLAPIWQLSPATGKYYLTLPDAVKWADGKAACEALSNTTFEATLVSISSSAENDFVLSVLEEMRQFTNDPPTTTGLSPNSFGCIGLKQMYQNLTYSKFTNNVSLTYTKWGPLEPNDPGDSCVGMFVSSFAAGGQPYVPGMWVDGSCTARICRPICQGSMRPLAPTWQLNPVTGKYYLTLPDADSWVAGKAACEAFSNTTFEATLVSISSSAENDFVLSVLEEMRLFTNDPPIPIGFVPNNAGFIGLRKMYQNLTYSKFTNNVSLTYTNWGPNDPDDVGDACVGMSVTSFIASGSQYEPGMWFDISCTASYRPICQGVIPIDGCYDHAFAEGYAVHQSGTKDNHPQGSIALLACNGTAIVSGSVFATCGADAQWHYPIEDPHCVVVSQELYDQIMAAQGTLSQYFDYPQTLHALLQEYLAYFTAQLDADTLRSLGHPVDEVVSECRYDGQKCGGSDFVEMLDPSFGNCFQFNNNASTFKYAIRAGASYGLSMQLFVNQSEYTSLTERAGVALFLHKQHSTVIMEAMANAIPPGYFTHITATYSSATKLAWPYGDCIEKLSSEKFYYDTTYSAEGCIRSNYQKCLIDECQCGDPRLPVPSGKKHCTTLQRNCVKNFADANSPNEADSSDICKPSCSDVHYYVTITQSEWPGRNSVPSICKGLSLADTDLCLGEYRRNYAMVTVYLERLSSESITESPAYDITCLLSDFGGLFGLYLGLSVISFAEIVPLFINLVRYAFQREMLEEEDFDPEDIAPKDASNFCF